MENHGPNVSRKYTCRSSTPEITMVSLVNRPPIVSGAGQCDLLDRRLAELTAAERDVFDLVRQGLSNKEIASARGRSTATVKNQLQSVFGKFGVNSRCRLIAWVR